jgi:ABC-type multidrug transport system fused ATPase/permease subunit
MVLAGLYASFQVGTLYNRARQTVQRADRQPTSRILGLVTSTTTGLSTIRAFGATAAFEERMHSCVDDLSKARRHFWIANRWLGLQMSLIGIMFSFGTGVVLLHSRPTATNAPLFGFALMFSMRFSSVMFKAVNGFGAFETAVVAANAISEFNFLETEDQNGIEFSDDWPHSGGVEMQGLSLRYSHGSPLVLDDINLAVATHNSTNCIGYIF